MYVERKWRAYFGTDLTLPVFLLIVKGSEGQRNENRLGSYLFLGIHCGIIDGFSSWKHQKVATNFAK